jgi:hypothetical protein
MLKFVWLGCLVFTLWCRASGQDGRQLAISGVYTGQSLFIQNPYLEDEKTYCIESIRLNNRLLNIDLKRSALIIAFEGIERNEPVFIRITSRDTTCIPVILNPEAIRYHNVFGFEYVFISDSLLTWKTRGEKPEARYIVEKFDYGYWRDLDTLKAQYDYGGAQYYYQPIFEEGINKFRIKYSLASDTIYSHEVEHMHYLEPVSFTMSTKGINFSRTCQYLLETENNEEIAAGYGKSIDLSGVYNGDYYLTLDEEQLVIIKWRNSTLLTPVKRKPSNN